MHKGWFILLIPCLLLLVLIDRPGLLQPGGRDLITSGNQAITFDSWSTDIRTSRYDESGNLEFILQASRQVHYLDDISALESPDLRLYQASGEDWNITADSGKIHPAAEDGDFARSPGIDRIELIDNVQLFQTDNFGNSMVLRTSFLSIDPQLEVLETDQPVHLSSDRIEQSAVGMYADLGNNTVTFFSQARGRYDPNGGIPDGTEQEAAQ